MCAIEFSCDIQQGVWDGDLGDDFVGAMDAETTSETVPLTNTLVEMKDEVFFRVRRVEAN